LEGFDALKEVLAVTNGSECLTTASESLRRNLAAIEEMVETFSKVFELDVATQAKRVKDQLQKLEELCFHETWDTAEVITSSLDWSFAELNYEASEFSDRVQQLDDSLSRLNQIYEQFVLPQAVVMLVGSLEVYLSTVFSCCLFDMLRLNHRAVSKISNRYNFQNWGDSVDAFRTFLGIELCPEGINNSEVVGLQQRRHVFVHRTGIIDERAAHQLSLPLSSIGERLTVGYCEVMGNIELVRRIGDHLHLSIGNREQNSHRAKTSIADE